MLSGILDKLIGNFDFIGNVLTADIVLTEAERSALSGACRALAPANWTDTFGSVITFGVAESTALNLVFMADKGFARLTAVSGLGARDSDINHTKWAVGRADTATDVVEVIVALRIEEVTPLFAVLSTVVNFTSTSTIGIRLVTVCSVVTEAALLWAVLPADWTNAREASLTFFIAKGTVLLHTIGAIRERFS